MANRRAIIECSQASISAIPYLFDDFTETDKQTLVAHFHSGKDVADVIRMEEQLFCFSEASCSCLIAIARQLEDITEEWRDDYCRKYNQFIQTLYRSKIASSKGEVDPVLELLTAASYNVIDKLSRQILEEVPRHVHGAKAG